MKRVSYFWWFYLRKTVKNALFCLIDRYQNVCVWFMVRNCRIPKVGTEEVFFLTGALCLSANRGKVGTERSSLEGNAFFFRPSPSRLSPGRNTVFVSVERIVQHLATPPLWESQKRAWTPTQSRYCPCAMATTRREKHKPKQKQQNQPQNQNQEKTTSSQWTNQLYANSAAYCMCWRLSLACIEATPKTANHWKETPITLCWCKCSRTWQPLVLLLAKEQRAVPTNRIVNK